MLTAPISPCARRSTLSVCLCIWLTLGLPMSISLSVHLLSTLCTEINTVCLSVCLADSGSAHVYLTVCPPFIHFVHVDQLSGCLSMSVCLSVCSCLSHCPYLTLCTEINTVCLSVYLADSGSAHVYLTVCPAISPCARRSTPAPEDLLASATSRCRTRHRHYRLLTDRSEKGVER
jgi:hypothetical protein